MRLCLIILLSALLAVSCGKSSRKSRRTPYDLGRSEALLQAGEAMMAEEADWERLAQSAVLDEQLVGILKDDAARRELFLAADALLQQERFHDFAALIDAAEKRGEATPALLELRGLPQALQALSLFCARRPYQNSQDLEQSMNFLSPWSDELSRLAQDAFPPFWESQKTLLEELRAAERKAKVERLQVQLCRKLTTTGANLDSPEWLLAEIEDVDAEAEILQYVSLTRKVQPGFRQALAEKRWNFAVELASELLWTSLTDGERAVIGECLAKQGACSLVGDVLQARFRRSPELYAEAVLRWQSECPEASLAETRPAFLGEALQCLQAGEQHWESPVPGIGETAEAFLRLIP